MPFNVRPLPPTLMKKAQEELFEDPSRNEEDVQILREWVHKQPHIKARLDDQFLLSFVRTNKHALERAKRKIDLFYTVRTALPELYKSRILDGPRIWDVIKLGVYLLPPKTLGEDGPILMISRPGFADLNRRTLYDVIRPGTIMQEIKFIEDDNVVTAGITQIIDVSGMTMAHFLQMDIVFLKKMAIFGGEGSIFRQKGMHFINMTPLSEKLFKIFMSFMTEKQKSRMYVHSNMESLFKHIPQQMLPQEYGGENGSLEQTIEYCEKSFAKYHDYFVEEDNFGTVEALRPPDSKFHPEAMFGMDGTFRKLEVD